MTRVEQAVWCSRRAASGWKVPEHSRQSARYVRERVGKPDVKRADTTRTVKPTHNYISASITAAAAC